MGRMIVRGAMLFVLALGVIACTSPSPTEVPTLVPVAEPTMAPATPEPEPTMSVTTSAAPAVQILPLQAQDQYYVGVTASALVLAADSDGLAAVDLFVNGVLQDSVNLAQSGTFYQGTLEWTPSMAGPHEVALEVRDELATVTQATWVTVDVQELAAGAPTPPPATPSGDVVPPMVSISLASAEITFGEDADVYVNAVDQGGIVKMDLYADNELVETWTHDESQGPPLESVFHTFTYRSVPEGSYDVFVRAFDSAGNAGQSVTERLDVNP